MQTFDGALYQLVEAGKISVDEAMKNADSPNNLRLKLSLNSKQPEKKTSLVNLSLMVEDEPEDEGNDPLAAQL
jgi:twitching motility protein PilU